MIYYGRVRCFFLNSVVASSFYTNQYTESTAVSKNSKVWVSLDETKYHCHCIYLTIAFSRQAFNQLYQGIINISIFFFIFFKPIFGKIGFVMKHRVNKRNLNLNPCPKEMHTNLVTKIFIKWRPTFYFHLRVLDESS